MMRSRDDGAAPFIYYFPKCASTHIKSWRDIKPYFETEHYKLLRKLYKCVEDIDLYAGLLLEKRCNNLMGLIGGCIVAQQFHNFRFGDRFFYSHPNNGYNFTLGSQFFLTSIYSMNRNNISFFFSAQKITISTATFSRFICMSSGVKQVPRSGFEIPSSSNPWVPCSEVGPIKLDSFKETI